MMTYLLKFALAMQKELINNSHKQGWMLLSDSQCLNRLSQELRELKKSVRENKPKEEVISECADVANFAMFLAHNYYQKGRV